MTNLIALEHPGLILQEEFLEPLELSAYKVAADTGLSRTALGEIIKGKRSISEKTGLILARYFGLSDDYFLKLQMHYNLDKLKQTEKESLKKIVKFVQKKKTKSAGDDLLKA
ncbi:HigA family addiction module antitoxin [Desulforhopalus sp. IMCC35007]|uniref:HigA family addiction module antitoxin n=1 Tax=Desulforhopalus sp. IMCC35007 TaxID=2569543 RepID=UPI0010AEC632|nr:HigA family addiction module antitoxin [Desulforhopalus sp. IMCC35007]TKB06553.1 addiction module antidote protein, HigA family [Desulforhopalus sp. IMCC35007]